MNFLEILGIACGLAMDATAVSIAASVNLGRVHWRQVFRFAFHFGLFQAVMPVLGWLAGRSLEHLIARWDHWVAFMLLCFVGGKAIYEALRDGKGALAPSDPTKSWSLIMLSVATSIDAAAVGLSFALLGVSIWLPIAVIGLVTALFSTLGMLLGSRLGMRFGDRVSILGGLVLIGIGVKILLEHIM